MTKKGRHKSRGEGSDRSRRLKLVLKCDSVGSLEAVESNLESVQHPKVEIEVISDGVGAISKSDIQMAITGSRLVIGFDVPILPKIDQLAKEQGVEIRIYQVIYNLTEDIKQILIRMVPEKGGEKITGRAEIIALFKSSRRGIIIGCRVREGSLNLGSPFRVISAMGPIYSGKIESLHIGERAVKGAKVDQEVGIKISDFNKAKVGDQVECYEIRRPDKGKTWRPRGGLFVVD
jgi:translation initiation factor IF-2